MTTTDLLLPKTRDTLPTETAPFTPDYLEKHYWWAYVRPWSVALWDHTLMVNLILWGQYWRLSNEAVRELGDDLCGKTLQVGCCYGNITQKLYDRVSRRGGTLDVIDVLPIQIENARRKVPRAGRARFMPMNAACLQFADGSYDCVLMFFLPHEQPAGIRENTVREAMRVLKPDGKLVIVDYGKSSRWHPLRYLLLPLLGKLKPFAKSQWNAELVDTLPKQEGRSWSKMSYFGGLWQKLVYAPAPKPNAPSPEA